MPPHFPAIGFAAIIAGALIGETGYAATFTVTNTNDTGVGSLRKAIIDANTNPGTDFIDFNIAGGGLRTIFLNSPLPTITGTVSINGASQPGFAGVPLIEIAGDLTGVGADGLTISNNSSQIGWLTINGFDDNGIVITGTGNATIVGCYIGISNDGVGTGFPNGGHGVLIDNSPDNDIGGTTANLRNIISNNLGSGVHIFGASSSDNLVQGNYIGTDVTGALGRQNDIHGIVLEECAGNTVGGTTAGARNIVSGNNNANIILLDCLSGGNTVQGNYVGLNAAGNATIAGAFSGINVLRSPNSLVGGTVAGARNVVSGNGSYNIEVSTFSEGTGVHGNYIGTDATGMVALGGGGFAGVSIFNVCNVTLGGVTSAARNVISGNAGDGVFLWGSSSFTCGAPDLIYGNVIGIAADGVTPMGNGEHGINVSRPSNHRIGNTTGGRNIIAHNGGAGVLVVNSSFSGVPSNGILISANSIYDNAGLGIDLSMSTSSPDGVTPNDVNDPDAGANQFQNFPILNGVRGQGSSLTLTGLLNSTPSTSFRIEVFGNEVCDSSGNGEGRIYLGFFDITTSVTGIWNFAHTIVTANPINYAWMVTVTARNLATGDTSEFSPCHELDSLACLDSPGGTCFAATPGEAGCQDFECCNLVCDIDPFCCDTAWDALCAAEAIMICGNCGNEQSGDCFTPNPTPGCYDSDCCAAVCAIDPFCCDVSWDATCAAEAQAMCAPPCPGDIPFVTPGVVDVSDLLFLLASWGETGPPRPRADLAPPPLGDNQVNVSDLLELLANWGPCL